MIKLQSIARQASETATREEVFAVDISVGDGLRGDIADGSQVLLLSKDSWIKVCAEAGVDLPWLTRGAHLLVKGFEFLPTDIGRTVHIGEVVLEITGEAAPCLPLQAQAPGLFDALQMGWRGGVSCQVMRGGSIQKGDDVSIAD